VFFSMHEPLVGDAALAIDGKRRPCHSFGIRRTDAFGWLVEVRDEQVSLHPALYDASSVPAPTLDLRARCGPLDECMQRFVNQFVLVRN